MKVFCALSILAVYTSLCTALPSGPPLNSATNQDYVCNAMAPNPASPHGQGTAGDGGYRLQLDPPMNRTAQEFTHTPNTVYTIRLAGTSGYIRGFLVQARVPGDTPTLGMTPMLLGSFQPGPGQQVYMYDCDGAGVANQATITHNQSQLDAGSVQFNWTSPNTTGAVNFYYTVVRVVNVHYNAISALAVGVLPPGPLPPITTIPTQQVTTPPPGATAMPLRSPDNYRLRVLIPDGCSRTECDLFIGIDTNTGDNGFLDIYMEGNAEGWLAVGFSPSPNMFTADVVGCNRGTGGMVEVIDSWNPPSPTRISTTDTIQDVTLYSGSFNGKRLNCTVSKRIASSDSMDLDLTNFYHIIWARRASLGDPGTLRSHFRPSGASNDSRGVSESRFRADRDQGVITQSVFASVHRPALIRTHGILMVIAWPLLAVSGIFFAFFMRPAMPNGEWFQVHRAFLLASLFIGALAFVLIFIALSNTNGLPNVNSGTSLAHMIMGIIIMALHIANPIVAIFRCKPSDSNRWIFNLVHAIIGFIAYSLAFTNVSLGLSIFTSTISETFSNTQAPLWLFVAWSVGYGIVFIPIAYIALVVYASVTNNKMGCSDGCTTADKPSPADKEMETIGEGKGDSNDQSVTKSPSKDAFLRWVFLAIYLIVTIPILFAVIVMIAVP